MTKFKIGDLVKLKSGGPLLTVTNIEQELTFIAIVCVWFDGGDPKVNKFKEETLGLCQPAKLN